MTDPRDGMHHMPDFGPPRPVVEPGEFVFAASHFDHGHVYAQVQGLVDAGGVLTYVYEPDADRAAEMLRRHPGAVAVDDFRRILDDPAVQLVTSAAIPDQRCAIGLEVLEAGKDYFTDKCPFTTLDQLAEARAATAATARKYMVSYSERLGNEAAWHAGTLIGEGAIGDVVQVLILAPHNLNAPARPDWFFEKQRYGGIITSAAMLSMNNGTHRTHPIARGAWIIEVIFNDPPPPPPNDVPPLNEDAGPKNLTIREKFAKHRENADCAGCHSRLDPLGFAMENFDITGRWRDKYPNGRDVDASGTLLRKYPFADPVKFKQSIVTEDKRFAKAFTAHLLRFALARELTPADALTVDQITQATAGEQFKLRPILREVIRSKPFQGR